MMGDDLIGIILAGGKSLRFGGDAFRPKPVIEVNGIPLVLRAAAKLYTEGATRICVLTGQNHDVVRDALGMAGDLSFLSVAADRPIPFELRYSGDETGSAGRLLAMERSELAGGALLSYTDVFTDAPLGPLRERARSSGAALALMTVSPRLPWGVVCSTDGLVSRFDEKPHDYSIRTNAGFYFCAPSMLGFIKDRAEMLEKEPMARMIEAKTVRSWHHEGQWAGIDSRKDVAEAEAPGNALFSDQKKPVLLSA
jgi:glucose-1-phosphate cytidylyltransferase